MKKYIYIFLDQEPKRKTEGRQETGESLRSVKELIGGFGRVGTKACLFFQALFLLRSKSCCDNRSESSFPGLKIGDQLHRRGTKLPTPQTLFPTEV